jgi:N-acetylneuraminate synthase/UDP-hydrolysing UDP-N-acetyl-D-glucosamine 2-epimerase
LFEGVVEKREKPMRKICVVTGSRAEYGHLFWLMKEIRSDAALRLQIAVTGTHLSPVFGKTVSVMEQDGFEIDRKIEIPTEDDSPLGVTRAMAGALSGFAEAFRELRPDMVVVLGDRFEMLAAAEAALLAKIPVAHLHGGEITEGAFDDAMRHAITKIALLHFTAAEPYRQRVIQMGEAPERVFAFGAPGLDHLERTSLLDRHTLEKKLGFTLGKISFLVTFHPVTLDGASSKSQVQELLSALDAFPSAKIIFTYPNADPDNAAIRRMLKDYAEKNASRCLLRESFGQELYLSLLSCASVMIGNSSSGLIERPSFKKPTVNIGDRQKGRLSAASVISCPPRRRDIVRAIRKSLDVFFGKTLPCVVNPYRGSDVSAKIKNVLRDFELGPGVMKKKFYEAARGEKNAAPCLVIAEAGVNHNGSLHVAKKLVEAAAASGADFVKFQTFKAERLVRKNTPKADYQEKASGRLRETQHEMLKKLELDERAHRELLRFCQKKGIGFLSSPFDEASVDLLVRLKVSRLKIPSGEITNAPLLLKMARTGFSLILSTGMATLAEIEEALGVIAFGYTRSPRAFPSRSAFQEAFLSFEGQKALRERVSLLHCVTEYPAPADEMNLLAMDVLKERFGLTVGLSDHTAGTVVAIAAAARGASVLEKHLTLDNRMPGPDHRASLEPHEFKEMVEAIRRTERALGARLKQPVPSERKNAAIVRKSLCAAKTIRKGEMFNEKNLTAMRPADGCSPMEYWNYLGQRAPRDFTAGERVR